MNRLREDAVAYFDGKYGLMCAEVSQELANRDVVVNPPAVNWGMEIRNLDHSAAIHGALEQKMLSAYRDHVDEVLRVTNNLLHFAELTRDWDMENEKDYLVRLPREDMEEAIQLRITNARNTLQRSQSITEEQAQKAREAVPQETIDAMHELLQERKRADRKCEFIDSGDIVIMGTSGQAVEIDNGLVLRFTDLDAMAVALQSGVVKWSFNDET